ncbi:TNF receptor-associated factor 6-like [Tropilaelaps mercedesae]|uniref:TNF receptor-associated factor 6-like n=1 Tax=Tropilaelaps mercedesae TaxID=418985 RepID=A0A1V9X016_9ACAR|nr:TNF receptor-associated factor 6-like [Tropilaelaps mercedesae]
MEPSGSQEAAKGSASEQRSSNGNVPSEDDNSMELITGKATDNLPLAAGLVKLMGLAGIPECTVLPFIDHPPPNILCAQCKGLGPSLWRFQCGHGFCGACFTQLMPPEITKTICPVDQQSVSRMAVFQDSSVQESAFPLRARCPHSCGETIRLCTLPVHLQFCDKLQKKLAMKRCFLRGLGCQFESDVEDELKTHESDLSLHRTIISMKIQELNHLDELRNQVNEALAALVDATRNQTELKSRIALLEGRLEEVHLEQTEASQAHFLPSVSQASVPQPRLSFQLGPMTITTYGGDTHIPSLGVTSTTRSAQELVCPNGIFQWKLSEFFKAKFKERHAHKKYTQSPSFYAGSPGYLFKLRLHLNGIGSSGRGKFLGVGIVLLKGQFDEQLGYPIHNPITVTLVDQSEKCPEDIVYRLADPCFPRPQGDYLVPYVWHEFVKLTDLESPRFLIDDSVVFRIQVSSAESARTGQASASGSQSLLYPNLD